MKEISVTPVKKYREPKYPTRSEADKKPELLKNLPSRWQKNAAVVVAAGFFGASSLSACKAELKDMNQGGFTDANYLNVAPIFTHGEGTGSIGCVMVAPPVFLSEQEALAIILEAAEDAGLNFTAVPPGYTATSNVKDKDYVLGSGSVGLKFYDEEKQVAISYISMKNAEEMYVTKDGISFVSSVSSYYPRQLAELSAEDFANQEGDISVGVLYDPGITFGESDESLKEELAAQVRDFIEWLQGQGII